MGPMTHAFSLGLFLYAHWLFFSGHYDRMFLSLGFASTLVAVGIAVRMAIVDGETYPVPRPMQLRVWMYWRWLAREVVKANLDVARLILSPSLPISPNVFTLKTSQRTDLGRVVFANSITLTPGTISIDLQGDTIQVHALTQEAAESLQTGEMDRRVTDMEGLI